MFDGIVISSDGIMEVVEGCKKGSIEVIDCLMELWRVEG